MFTLVVLSVSLSATTLAGCGSSSSTEEGNSVAESSAMAVAAGEKYEIVSPQAVHSGLAQTIGLATEVAGTPKDQVAAKIEILYTTWFAYEGTVRETDSSRYLDIEDALGAVKTAATAGDAAATSKAATTFAELAKAYMVAHPITEAPATEAALGPVISTGTIDLTDSTVGNPSAVKAGVNEFTIKNNGQIKHELLVIRTDLPVNGLPMKDGSGFNEKGSGLTFIGEVSNVQGRATSFLKVDLPAGRYVFACNLPGHYKEGMATEVIVK
jgi:uncharacterized cupredoxin-like copper-binding protein